jgi:putative DNA primase/helicase
MTAKPVSLTVKIENIPSEMKEFRHWVIWRYNPQRNHAGGTKWSKVPFQASGEIARTNDPSSWTDFDSALSSFIQNSGLTNAFDGLGFVFTESCAIKGIDLDDCVDPVTGKFNEIASELLARIRGYAEISPSGTGIKIFTRFNLSNPAVDHKKGIEIYPLGGRYFTVTGHVIEGHNQIPSEVQDIDWFIQKHFNNRETAPTTGSSNSFEDHLLPLENWTLERVEQDLLSKLDPSMGHDHWLKIGMALFHQFEGSSEAELLWDSWSANGDNYTGDCERRWKSFSNKARTGRGAVTLRTVIWMVRDLELKAALNSGEVVLDSRNYMRNAHELLERDFTNHEGPNLVYTNGEWYRHNSTCYQQIESETVRKSTWNFLDKAKKQKRNGSIVDFLPSPGNVTGTIDALRTLCHLEATSPPTWLPGKQGHDPRDLVSLKNGLFHIPTEELLAHTSGYFTINSLPFDWDPNAIAPTWLSFLGQIWGDDQESIMTLQEIMGYVLTHDTSMQKIFKLIGPKRSGKGTIARVIAGLIGSENVAGPTLASLTQNFGLQPLVGKMLAIIADARTPQSGRSQVVERLLMISGEDLATVDRKNKDPWIGKLNTRILIMTNEPLQLEDASGALIGRLIVLKLGNSFFGKEDHQLTAKLLKELPGIFRWSLEGRKRLYTRGHFVMPCSSAELVDELNEISSPISEFLNVFCDQDHGAFEPQDILYEAWISFCRKNGRLPGAKASFSKQLKAAAPNISSFRPNLEGERRRCYSGIRIKDSMRDIVISQCPLDSHIQR